MNLINNKVQLTGRLGNSPEVKVLDGGRKMARFSLATTDFYVDSKGVNINETQWHKLVAWGREAEQAEKQLGKGTEVSIEGKLVHRNYTDKDGTKRYITEVVVAEILLEPSKNKRAE